MAATRKLQAEIDRCMKKVGEGVDRFDDVWKKVHNASNANQKEKYEEDLKKEIKKLQRLRDQIKTWIASAEIKDKSALMDKRKLIEMQMERFKVVERETKTKAYSKEGLTSGVKLDPAEKQRTDISCWMNQCLDSLKLQIDQLEAEIESMGIVGKKKKGRGKDEHSEKVGEVHGLLEKHRDHVKKLEALLRMLDNETVDINQIIDVKDDVEYYIENCQDPDFMENELIYTDIEGLEEMLLDSVQIITDYNNSNSVDASETLSTASCGSPPPPPPASLSSTTMNNHSIVSGNFENAIESAGDKRRHKSSNDEIFSRMNSCSGAVVGSFPNSSGSISFTSMHHNKSNNIAVSSTATTCFSISSSPPLSSCSSSVSSNSTFNQQQHYHKLPSTPKLPPTSALTNHQYSASVSNCSANSSSAQPPANFAAAVSAQQNGVMPASCELVMPPYIPRCSSPVPLIMHNSTPLLQNPPSHPSTSIQQIIPLLSLASMVPPTISTATLVSNMSGSNSIESTSDLPLSQQNLNTALIPRGPTINKDSLSSLVSMAQNALERAGLKQDVAANMSINNNGLSDAALSVENSCLSSPPPPCSSPLSVAAELQTCLSSSIINQSRLFSSPSKSTETVADRVSEANVPALLGVAPLGPVVLTKESHFQYKMLEAAYQHMPHPSESERIRAYLPRNPCATPAYYVPVPHMAQSLKLDSAAFYQRMSTETLFFVFYYMEGSFAQYLAAKALKKQSWRFHTRYMMWFQRHEEPKIINDEYELGTYVYFDYEKWGQRKKESFTFEYRFLEDKEL